MPPKFQPTKGAERRRSDKADNTRHLRDENTYYEEEVQEVEINAPSPDEGSDNEASSIPVEDTEPRRGDIIKGKMQGFRDSLCWQVKGAEKQFQEGLTTTARGHLKCSIAEEVRIIDSELLEYPYIEAKYKLYGLEWISEEPGHYYPTMVRKFYANYIVILEVLCRKGKKPSGMQMQKCVPVRERWSISHQRP
ncbi:hypothetical protein HAX54_022579 [Datura stramonium]|uniref:Uncharacterized protein n=1 Tax=Datura stramonium TaxID=4076 RepID=A0ABS8Y4D1_DATST|nr:hypothetical protein [Datura stramonium]